jgi:hypothetical protein
MLRFFLFFTVLGAPAAAQVAASTAVVTVDQLYSGRSRDPMVPATVFGDQTGTAKLQAQDTAVCSFSIYALSLTGVMEDSGGKQAILTDTAKGLSYLLKAGRLYDQKKKPVPGVAGVIKGKQVILMTDDKKVRQINLRE